MSGTEQTSVSLEKLTPLQKTLQGQVDFLRALTSIATAIDGVFAPLIEHKQNSSEWPEAISEDVLATMQTLRNEICVAIGKTKVLIAKMILFGSNI